MFINNEYVCTQESLCSCCKKFQTQNWRRARAKLRSSRYSALIVHVNDTQVISYSAYPSTLAHTFPVWYTEIGNSHSEGENSNNKKNHLILAYQTSSHAKKKHYTSEQFYHWCLDIYHQDDDYVWEKQSDISQTYRKIYVARDLKDNIAPNSCYGQTPPTRSGCLKLHPAWSFWGKHSSTRNTEVTLFFKSILAFYFCYSKYS